MNQYFEQMILTASPVELIRFLYQRAINSVRDAREHLRNGQIMERGRSINNAYMVLMELSQSLNSEEAPDLARRLSGLYVYMQKRLLEANLKQQEAPLSEVLSLLTTLDEGWRAVPDSVETPALVAPRNPWAHAAANLVDDEPVHLALSA